MTEPVTIPDEAVEAATIALNEAKLFRPPWGYIAETSKVELRAEMRAALEAAVPAILAAERERIAAEAELMADELGWDGLTGELHEVRDYVKDLLHRLAAVARGES